MILSNYLIVKIQGKHTYIYVLIVYNNAVYKQKFPTESDSEGTCSQSEILIMLVS